MTRALARITILLAALLVAVTARAQTTFDAAMANSKADLDAALAELSALRQQVATEKIPLAKKLNALEDEVLIKRREFERVARLRGAKAFDLENLKAEVKARRDENIYVTNLLDEYIRAFESRIQISEIQRYKDVIVEAKLVIEDVNASPAQKFQTQVALVKSAMKRLDRLVGGDVFDGSALTLEGNLEKGKFALVGPIAVFASAESPQAGVSEMVMGAPEATVLEIPDEFKRGIRNIVNTGSGDLPVDASLGSAIKIARTKETIVQHVLKGGPVMVPILGLALAAAIVSIIKWVQISGYRVARAHDLQKILDSLSHGDKAKALEHAESIRGPAGEMLKLAVEHADERKEVIEEVLYEKVLSTKPQLERMLPFIAVTAISEPLLGLLGTVTGMIRTFKLITVFGTGDPKLLSSGISEALITTEFGLIIAIPALLLHAILLRRARGVVGSMERTAVGFINGLPEKKR